MFSDNADGTLSGSGTDYMLTGTPTDTNSITISIAADVFTDAVGNGNTATDTLSVTYVDTTAPLVTLSGAPDTANSLAPFAVTAAFSEDVTLVLGAEIEVTNGAATLSGSGANYTLTITPDGNGDMSITIPADVAVDAAGNGNTASDPVSVTYDATAPTVMLAGPDTLSNLAPFEVTATFSLP